MGDRPLPRPPPCGAGIEHLMDQLAGLVAEGGAPGLAARPSACPPPAPGICGRGSSTSPARKETEIMSEPSRHGRLLNRREVIRETSLSKSTIYARIAAGTFPAPHPLSPSGHRVAWTEREIEAWKAATLESPST